MRAFLGLAALSLGVLGPLPDIQPNVAPASAPEPQVVVRTSKSDRQRTATEMSIHATPRAGAELEHAEMPVESDWTAMPEDIDPVAATEQNTGAEDSDTSGSAVPEARDASSEELCDAVLSSAQANDLPLAFFSNLIWQESRFHVRSVSHAGAQGIAQFMPATAARSGVEDPFDPFQALPASARLLRQLRDQFGNIGLAAAAYNAGPGRVTTFLRGGKLPRETRAYVRIITGHPAEQWRGAATADAVKLTPRLPCRQMPIFADLDVALMEAAQSDPSDAPAARKDQARVPASQHGGSFARAALRGARGPLKRLEGRLARQVAQSDKSAPAKSGKGTHASAQKSSKTHDAAREVGHGPQKAAKTPGRGKHRVV